MSDTTPVIDFTELSSSVQGENLEQLTRLLGRALGLGTEWTGRGADGGLDLLFSEHLSGSLSKQRRRWVVSCKDKARSGSSVLENDLPSITDKVKQHQADGFLLVTTTTVGTAAKALIDSLDASRGGPIYTLVWDAAELTSMLLVKSNENLLEQFFPKSYERLVRVHTMDQALSILRKELPADLFHTIYQMVSSTSTRTLDGESVWPYDHEVAAILGKIARLLLQEQDLDAAVDAAQTVGFDAIRALAVKLSELDSGIQHDFLAALVNSSFEPDLRFNAFQLLIDEHEVSPNEQIHLASSLEGRYLSAIYGMEIQAFVTRTFYSYQPDMKFTKQLEQICDTFDVDTVHIDFMSVEPSHTEAITFKGGVTLELTLGDEIGRVFEAAFPGSFTGYFDISGFFMESAVIDTSSVTTS